jgi:hypothetical protein
MDTRVKLTTFTLSCSNQDVILFYGAEGLTVVATARYTGVAAINPDWRVRTVALWKSRVRGELYGELKQAHSPYAHWFERARPWTGFGSVETIRVE